ncbi:quino protein amine dehydrogenase beta chain-like protein [Athelia psychrophila]|uniref:Quino protein amine dehydrogenase beta chain-like protein n=1 Tax=Athelia psychrophila TaxID=1759441 RepID=A0A166FB67_9AGAM|nr:quino protein amine dehydrogenase beta chain-like protein [Fibularhizoctonia sp. CBS 109695]
MRFTSAFWIPLIPAVFAASIVGRHSSPDITTARIGQLPKGSWAEGLAVRSNGQLLVTLVTDAPEIHQIDPFTNKTQLIDKLPIAGGLLGITEIQHDVFAIVAGNISQSGSFSMWKLDMKKNPPKSTKIADIKPGVLLNGVTSLNKNGSAILVADSGAGVVYRVDTETGDYAVVIDDPTMKIAPNSTLQVGINGLHIREKDLYYTSSTQGLFVRMRIHPDGTPAGAAKVIAHNGQVNDDFTFDRAGNYAYVATNSDNMVQRITPGGHVTVVAGKPDSKVVAGATAVEFGRTRADKSVLYVTTDGKFTNAAGKTIIGTGGVVAIYGIRWQ